MAFVFSLQLQSEIPWIARSISFTKMFGLVQEKSPASWEDGYLESPSLRNVTQSARRGIEGKHISKSWRRLGMPADLYLAPANVNCFKMHFLSYSNLCFCLFVILHKFTTLRLLRTLKRLHLSIRAARKQSAPKTERKFVKRNLTVNQLRDSVHTIVTENDTIKYKLNDGSREFRSPGEASERIKHSWQITCDDQIMLTYRQAKQEAFHHSLHILLGPRAHLFHYRKFVYKTLITLNE